MITNMNRRNLIKNLGLLFLAGGASRWSLADAGGLNSTAWPAPANNFKYIYENSSLKAQFLLFLTNVFHLYPQDKLHDLISQSVGKFRDDKDIYDFVQSGLPSIAPLLKDIRYAMPALSHQKQVMQNQTLELLGSRKRFDAYLELGSSGRYLDVLEESLEIGDQRYFIAEKPATYSIADWVDRGQIAKAGDWFSLNQYQPDAFTNIPAGSLDLVTVYIGFHHCPIPLRNDFISSIARLMKPDGVLIVRDHQVNSIDMYHMVALAHDVFNLGTQETLTYNQAELRNFYSLEDLALLMQMNGFKTDGRRLLQAGDPTQNTLMVYTKV